MSAALTSLLVVSERGVQAAGALLGSVGAGAEVSEGAEKNRVPLQLPLSHEVISVASGEPFMLWFGRTSPSVRSWPGHEGPGVALTPHSVPLQV